MISNELTQTVACCGLVCGLCHLASECPGCRTQPGACEKLQGKKATCYQRKCCSEKGLLGCWECSDFPCGQDMFSPSHDIKIQAYVQCIREEGLGNFIGYLLENQKKGIQYGYNKDYDHRNNIQEVLDLLRGNRKP